MMFVFVQNFKIFDPVVPAQTVDVMHNFILSQMTAQLLFHDKAVFGYNTIVAQASVALIAFGIHDPTALCPARVAATALDQHVDVGTMRCILAMAALSDIPMDDCA